MNRAPRPAEGESPRPYADASPRRPADDVSHLPHADPGRRNVSPQHHADGWRHLPHADLRRRRASSASRRDLLAVGELLVDFISTEVTASLATARTFERIPGGSPANIAVNVARLGGRAAMMANVGDDALGSYLIAALAGAGVDVGYVTRDPRAHTSVVFVARTRATPDFLPLRDADLRLGAGADAGARLAEAVDRARAVHISSWLLSHEPARGFARRALHLARAQGRLTSLDPNYSPRVWPNCHEALTVLAAVLPDVDIVKPSADDAARLFGTPTTGAGDAGSPDPAAVIARFHAMGPRIVLYTMGRCGTMLSVAGQATFVPARQLPVVDATGAGDAFWAGYLLATLDGLSPLHAAYVARDLAGIKLQTVGPLPADLDRAALYAAAAQAMTADRPSSAQKPA